MMPECVALYRIVDFFPELLSKIGRVSPSQALASGCHSAEVTVDEAAALTHYPAVYDEVVTIGRQAAQAQIKGGIVRGVSEETVNDAGSGQSYAASRMDYTLL
jgi:CO/xanthine dehydrogenase Mo-binding subunit